MGSTPEELGFTDRYPRIASVQSTGNTLIVRAFREGKNPSEIEPWEKPDTIAGGLADPYPWDGDAALAAIRETRGTAVAVPDNDILEAELLLASREGIFAEPSGATSLAGFIDLVKLGVVAADDTVVVTVTGSGLKDAFATARFLKKARTISPTIEELEKEIATGRI
jgi:threonine synthase